MYTPPNTWHVHLNVGHPVYLTIISFKNKTESLVWLQIFLLLKSLWIRRRIKCTAIFHYFLLCNSRIINNIKSQPVDVMSLRHHNWLQVSQSQWWSKIWFFFKFTTLWFLGHRRLIISPWSHWDRFFSHLQLDHKIRYIVGIVTWIRLTFFNLERQWRHEELYFGHGAIAVVK